MTTRLASGRLAFVLVCACASAACSTLLGSDLVGPAPDGARATSAASDEQVTQGPSGDSTSVEHQLEDANVDSGPGDAGLDVGATNDTGTSSQYFVDDFPSGQPMHARWQRSTVGPEGATMGLAQTSNGLVITPAPVTGENRTGYLSKDSFDLRGSHLSVVLADRGSKGDLPEIGIYTTTRSVAVSVVNGQTFQVWDGPAYGGARYYASILPASGAIRLEIRNEVTAGGSDLVFIYEAPPNAPVEVYRFASFDVSQQRVFVQGGCVETGIGEAPMTFQHFVFAPN